MRHPRVVREDLVERDRHAAVRDQRKTTPEDLDREAVDLAEVGIVRPPDHDAEDRQTSWRSPERPDKRFVSARMLFADREAP
jgi:hypothetical protein